MDWNELIERLNGYEWNDVDFKEALESCPTNCFETVSAFANTAGGWLVFGVREDNGSFEIIGVQRVNKVETEFLSTLHNPKRINYLPAVREGKISDGTRTVLTFFIPEAPREAKPVYLNGDIRKSYIRRGSGDHQCTEDEIKTFLREAAGNRYDSEILSLDVTNCFDEDSIRWYRTQWQPRNPDKLADATSLDFLKYFGLIIDNAGKPQATRAAVLLFGSDSAIMTILPRPVADFRRLSVPFDFGIPDETRWEDRGVMECNLITAWRRILEHYGKIADVPFSLDTTSMERQDKPRDYTAFREALINLLTHQDYGDQTRKASIQVFRDRIIFWNPGSAFVTREEMFTPGDRPVRNPRIVNAFRRIGLGEQAGTGMGAIYSNWRKLKRVPPMIENDKSGHSFSIHLLTEEIVSEEQILLQAKMGVHLTEDEAALFAQLWREGHIWPLEARAITGLTGLETDAILNRLVIQRLIEQKEGIQGKHYVLAPHIREMLRMKAEPTPDAQKGSDMVTDQATGRDASFGSDKVPPLAMLTEPQRKIVQFCDSAKPIAVIMRHLGVTNRTFFRRTHLEPLVKNGVIKPTFPDSPQHPKQAYILTDAGFDLKRKFDADVKATE